MVVQRLMVILILMMLVGCGEQVLSKRASTPAATDTIVNSPESSGSDALAEQIGDDFTPFVDESNPTVISLADSWAKKVGPIVEVRCASCHNGVDRRVLDSSSVWITDVFTGLAASPAYEGVIVGRIKMEGEGQMPPTGSLPAAEIAAINSWIEEARLAFDDLDLQPDDGSDDDGDDGFFSALPSSLYWDNRITTEELAEDFTDYILPIVNRSCSNCHGDTSESPLTAFTRWTRNARNECLFSTANCVVERVAVERKETDTTMPPAYDVSSLGLVNDEERTAIVQFASRLTRVIAQEGDSGTPITFTVPDADIGPASVILDGLALQESFAMGFGVAIPDRMVRDYQGAMGVVSLRTASDTTWGLQTDTVDLLSQNYLKGLRFFANFACGQLIERETTMIQEGNTDPRRLIQSLDELPTADQINRFMEIIYRAPARNGELHPGAEEIYQRLVDLQESGARYYVARVYHHVCLAAATSPAMFIR